MTEVQLTPWDGRVLPSEDSIRALVKGFGLDGYIWSNGPHDEYPPHAHGYDKVLFVLAGSITWLLPETRQELTTFAGDRLDLPRAVELIRVAHPSFRDMLTEYAYQARYLRPKLVPAF